MSQRVKEIEYNRNSPNLRLNELSMRADEKVVEKGTTLPATPFLLAAKTWRISKVIKEQFPHRSILRIEETHVMPVKRCRFAADSVSANDSNMLLHVMTA